MTAPTAQPVLAAFRSQGLRPVFDPQPESVEATVVIAGERYYGYSDVNNETALLDLLSDLPESENLRLTRAIRA